MNRDAAGARTRTVARAAPVRAWTIAAVLAAVVSASCGQGSTSDTPVIDEAPAPQRDAAPLTLEEAGFLAAGALFEIYGARADPVPAEVDAVTVSFRGQRVWRLDVIVQVTLGSDRTDRSWRMWVGTLGNGRPGVLRARERTG